MTYFIALIILLLPSYLIRFSILGVPTTLLEILIYIALILTIFQQFSVFNFQFPIKSQFLRSKEVQNSKSKSQINKYLIPIILFVLSGVISVFIAPDKREALGLFKAYIVDPIIFFWIIVSSFQFPIFSFQSIKKLLNFQTKMLNENCKIENSLEIRNWKLEILIKSLILSGVLVSIHAIWQKTSGNVTQDGRILGIFGYNPNYLALYLAPIVTLAIVTLLNCQIVKIKNDIKTLIFCYPITLLLIYGVWLTGSRAAIGAVVAGVLSFFVIKYWTKIKSKKIFVFLVTLLLIALLLIGWQQTRPDWTLTRENGGRISSSNNIRWEIWQTTIKDILPKNNNWFLGVGLGNYQNYFTNLTNDRVNYPEWISPLALTPHNILLNIWVNLGLLGLISFIWIIINFFKSQKWKPACRRGRVQSQCDITKSKNDQKIILNTYYLILTSAMITVLTQGLVDSPVWKNDLVIMFWLFLALGHILQRNKNQAEG